MKRIFSWILDAAVLAAVLSAAIAAEAAGITGPTSVAPGDMIQLVSPVAPPCLWYKVNGKTLDKLTGTASGKWIVTFEPSPGTYTYVLKAGSETESKAIPGTEATITLTKESAYWHVVTVSGTPVPPDPPKPDPTPTPDPPPIPVAGLHVFVVYDPLDAKLTDSQRANYGNTLYAAEVQAYLTARCVKGKDNAPAFRIAKPGADFSRDDAVWQGAAATPHAGIDPPYVIVSNGQNGVVTALPQTAAELLKLLKKYGGE